MRKRKYRMQQGKELLILLDQNMVMVEKLSSKRTKHVLTRLLARFQKTLHLERLQL